MAYSATRSHSTGKINVFTDEIVDSEGEEEEEEEVEDNDDDDDDDDAKREDDETVNPTHLRSKLDEPRAL